MRLVFLFSLAAILATVAQAGSPHLPVNQNAVRHQLQDEQQHRPLGQTLGTFTEEQESSTNDIQSGEEDRSADARKKVRGAKLFRPRSTANEDAVIDRAVNRKQRQNRLRSSSSPSVSLQQAEEDRADEVDEDRDDDAADEPMIQRYDVDPATHPLP